MKNFSMHSFVAGIMLGALLAGAWFFEGDATLFTSEPFSRTATSTASVPQASGAVAVIDQSSGSEVIVESVTVPPPGVWVAVREVSGGLPGQGELGNVLGAVRVGGPNGDFVIPLLRPTEPERSYAIQLYRDDGVGDFDPSVNSVYVDFDTGARVVTYFNTN